MCVVMKNVRRLYFTLAEKICPKNDVKHMIPSLCCSSPQTILPLYIGRFIIYILFKCFFIDFAFITAFVKSDLVVHADQLSKSVQLYDWGKLYQIRP